jgi:hypothetical protein
MPASTMFTYFSLYASNPSFFADSLTLLTTTEPGSPAFCAMKYSGD